MKPSSTNKCTVTHNGSKKPCKINPPKKNVSSAVRAEVSVGLAASQVGKHDDMRSFALADMKFRMFYSMPSQKAGLGIQIQGFHSIFKFANSQVNLQNENIAGVSAGPYLDARLVKSVPLHITLSPQIGATFIGRNNPQLYLGFDVGLKLFVTKRLFIQGHMEVGSINGSGSDVDVYNINHPTSAETSNKGYLFVRGGLSLGVTLF